MCCRGGLDRGLALANPCTRGGRLHHATRRDNVWTDADEARFLEHAPAHLHLPLLLGLWTGQRQGDLVRLLWSAYDGTHIRLQQSKTRARVVIPVGTPLKAILDATPKRATMILTNHIGQPWPPHAFASAWIRACKRAGIIGLTFNDLRGTAVTRARHCRMHRGRDCRHHRPRAARRALNPRFALPAPRPRAGRERHRQARNENEKLPTDRPTGESRHHENGEKPRRMKAIDRF